MPTLVNEYLLPKDKSTEYLILAIVLFLIIISWIVIFYFTTKNATTNVTAYEICPVGSCPTNRFTGEKRCSKNTALPLEYDPIFEVCNPLKSCTDDSTPYALQSDGSTNLAGKCDVNGCRCVDYLTTPSYVEVIFNSQGGSIYNPKDTRTILAQQPNPYVGEGNNVPIIYTDASLQFWELSPSLLSYVVPSPCSTIFANAPEPSIEQLLYCINLNPCIAGRLAYVPSNAAAFAAFNATNLSGGVPMACVPNTVENAPDPTNNPNSCATQSGTYYTPVFSTMSGKISCIDTGIAVL